jgi:hypothetical protein
MRSGNARRGPWMWSPAGHFGGEPIPRCRGHVEDEPPDQARRDEKRMGGLVAATPKVLIITARRDEERMLLWSSAPFVRHCNRSGPSTWPARRLRPNRDSARIPSPHPDHVPRGNCGFPGGVNKFFTLLRHGPRRLQRRTSSHEYLQRIRFLGRRTRPTTTVCSTASPNPDHGRAAHAIANRGDTASGAPPWRSPSWRRRSGREHGTVDLGEHDRRQHQYGCLIVGGHAISEASAPRRRLWAEA